MFNAHVSLTHAQLLLSLLGIGACALVMGCTAPEEVAPEPTATEPSAPPTGSYEDFTSEQLVEVFNLREHDVPVRDIAGWAPPQKVVVVVPEEWDRREERMAFLQCFRKVIVYISILSQRF